VHVICSRITAWSFLWPPWSSQGPCRPCRQMKRSYLFIAAFHGIATTSNMQHSKHGLRLRVAYAADRISRGSKKMKGHGNRKRDVSDSRVTQDTLLRTQQPCRWVSGPAPLSQQQACSRLHLASQYPICRGILASAKPGLIPQPRQYLEDPCRTGGL